MEQGPGYSLWLVPRGAAKDKLAGIISRLSEQCTSPLFNPHVTLLPHLEISEEEVVAKTTELAKRIRKFIIEFNGINMMDSYYRSLYISAIRSPQLLAANRAAQKMFDTQGTYDPHLSLLYSDINQAQKETLLPGIQGKYPASFSVDGITVVNTTGNTTSWQSIASFSFP